MYLKVHETKAGRVVAVCDEDLIGKVLEDKKVMMDLNLYRGFYVGKKAGKEDVKDALQRFSSANLVGKDSVEIAIITGIAGKQDVMYIKKTPYIQIYKL